MRSAAYSEPISCSSGEPRRCRQAANTSAFEQRGSGRAPPARRSSLISCRKWGAAGLDSSLMGATSCTRGRTAGRPRRTCAQATFGRILTWGELPSRPSMRTMVFEGTCRGGASEQPLPWSFYLSRGTRRWSRRTAPRLNEGAVRSSSPALGRPSGSHMSVRSGETYLDLRIVVLHPPAGVSFAVQEGRSALLPPIEVQKDQIAFRFTVRVDKQAPGDEPNFLGSFTQGPRGARFVYVNSGKRAGQKDSCWDRRAKVPLGGLTWSLVKSALARRGAVIEARLNGVGADGGPTCGSVALVGR